MFARDRRGASGAGSPDLLAVMPYARFLDEALQRLPASFHYKGDVERGVRWVYPSPDKHDPKRHFALNSLICWYEFKSTSTNSEVMTRPHFCGTGAGPRTVFTVDAKCGYSIAAFSAFGEEEAEVLFRPSDVTL